jgi:hypothetical protein
MYGIYNCIPETNHVSWVHSVAAVLCYVYCYLAREICFVYYYYYYYYFVVTCITTFVTQITHTKRWVNYC